MSVDFGFDTEPGWAEREFFGSGWSETVAEPGWAEREFFGPGWSETVGTGGWGSGASSPDTGLGWADRGWADRDLGRDGGAESSSCPAGYQRGIVCAAVYRTECLDGFAPPGDGLPAIDRTLYSIRTAIPVIRGSANAGCCRCVPLETGPVDGRPPEPPEDGSGPPDSFRRIGDAILQFLSGGGGGIVIPQLPQPQVVAAPVTRSTLSPVAVLLVLAGVAGVGWWVYTRTRRRS